MLNSWNVREMCAVTENNHRTIQKPTKRTTQPLNKNLSNWIFVYVRQYSILSFRRFYNRLIYWRPLVRCRRDECFSQSAKDKWNEMCLYRNISWFYHNVVRFKLISACGGHEPYARVRTHTHKWTQRTIIVCMALFLGDSGLVYVAVCASRYLLLTMSHSSQFIIREQMDLKKRFKTDWQILNPRTNVFVWVEHPSNSHGRYAKWME